MDEQVLNVLKETLSPQENIRRNAEDQLRQLSVHPEGSLSLARISQNPQVDLFQRQSAGVLLQHYINNHWSPISNTFQEPVIPHEAKEQIRPLIFNGLSDPERKIRLASAHALSTIARSDWPDDYPSLLSQLVHLLHTGSAASVHGAMRVITEFVKNDLSEDQLMPVVEGLMPALLGVLGDERTHSYPTRAETISTFRQVLKMLDTVREEHPAAVRKALDDLSPQWLGAMRALLEVDAAREVGGCWEALGLRIEIFRTLTMLQSRFPKLLLPSLPAWFTLTLSTLTSLEPLYEKYYLSTGVDAAEPPSPTDSNFASAQGARIAQRADLDDMACAAFDFMIPTGRMKELKVVLVQPSQSQTHGQGGVGEGTEVMRRVIGVVGTYMRVTRTNEEEWLEDANAFVMDEDEEAEQYSVRTVGIDVVGAIMDKYPTAVAQILHTLAQSAPQEASQLRANGMPTWWKGLEATLALLGGLADDIRDRMEEDEMEGKGKSIELGWVFESVIPGLLDQSDTPFLQGRAFVFASQFAGLLPEQLASQYLGAAVNALDSANVGVPVKISAVKTVKNFCRFVAPTVLQSSSHRILSLLLPLLGQATGETLYLILETIRAVLGLDEALLNVENVGEVVEPLYAIWEANTSDPIATAIIEETFDTLASRPTIISRIVTLLAPRLAHAIAGGAVAAAGQDEDDQIHVPGEAVQLANSLLRTRGGPIEAELVETITAAVIGTLGRTDDMDVIQHGMVHLTLVVRKDADRLIGWSASDGTPGLTAIFHLLARFLDPQFSESGGIFVGDLIMHLFRKAGHAMGGVLPDLLRAVVQRLASAKMPMFIQSLVLPFAYLFSTEHTTSTVDLLSQIFVTLPPTGETKSGLELVLSSWCETSETVTGSWNIRVTDLGMLKLFTLADPRVASINVKGDLIVDEQNRDRIMTRSRTKDAPHRYTQIPFPLKALKLLLKDVQGLQGGKKGKSKGAAGLEGVEEDDGDEDWDDDDDDFGGSDVGEFDYLSSWLDAGGPDGDTQDDDEDLKSDPIAQIDLASHLTDTIRQCYASNVSSIQEMIPGLTDVEKGIMKGLLTL